jgi:hypothetical protein
MNTVYYIKLFITLMVMTAIPLKKPTGKADGKGFAVVELFTSEGCSSCPPADELMARIQKETEGEAVYILAYHVDYWDRLGWKDVFSSAEYSSRQLEYGRWLNVSPVYTPQAIINGKNQFVGSEASAIRHAISEQLATNPVATLTIQATQEGERLILKYQASHTLNDSRLLLAIVQKAAQTKVLRGENAGHLLSHIQIVRKLQSERLVAGEGSAVIVLPKGFNAQNWEAVVMVQDQQNGEILAVAKVKL